MTPILLELPDHFETERLHIRMPRPGDGVAAYEAVLESIAELRAWPASLPWALHEPSPASSEVYCRTGHSAFLARSDLPMLVIRKDSQRLVGATGLHRLNWSVPRCEVGYWGRQSEHGQGFITEAVQGITQFALRQLHMRRVECLTDALNLPSRRVAERAGFAMEGVMRHERKAPDGSLRDTCVYAITA